MIPPIALAVRAFNRRLRRLTRETQRSMGDINQVLQESIEGQKVVKIFGGQAYEEARFKRRGRTGCASLLMKEQAAAAANVPVVQLFAAIAVGVVIHQVIAGRAGGPDHGGQLRVFHRGDAAGDWLRSSV